ncbi:GreA/GreB family elongation factor [Bradyrhizobium sp. BWA-3-5]|uniref:GreA/GreB family elongation factor n=1 Tax=Bradyrhizobium sp. BWA-3-5 TaxID=3080013 RepID=UPI00293E4F2B|nr:GreA/GreB family elongation factor [Bradyrhizobium sp. BWA-3-5]WOH67811.1 GreA/GreB family elongation factor [Bradyrhizobium sp. BWA-3-5]
MFAELKPARRAIVDTMVVVEEVTVSDIKRNRLESRPSIVLTAFDRERLTKKLGDTLSTADIETALFLRQEIERADIAADDVPLSSVVRIGCEVKFVDHAEARIQHARLVLPNAPQCSHCISVLTPTGTALIGLGPGQSIRWTEQGRERSLAVLEVSAMNDN